MPVTNEKLEIVDEEFEIYDLELNDTLVDTDSRFTRVSFDSDGDVRVKIAVDEEDLLSVITIDAIITYLEESGYKVEEE